MRRSQQKVQPASRMKISRDSECDEPQVVRGFPEDRHGHNRNHVEEGCVRKPNKCKDTTFYDDVHDAPRQTDRHTTSWRSDVPPPCLGGASHGWVPVNRHCTPVLTSVPRLRVPQPRPRARASDTQASSTRREQQGCRPPSVCVCFVFSSSFLKKAFVRVLIILIVFSFSVCCFFHCFFFQFFVCVCV